MNESFLMELNIGTLSRNVKMSYTVNNDLTKVLLFILIVRNRKRLTFLKNKIKNTYRLYVSKLFGERFYVIAISDMYHTITILHASFLPIRAAAY